MPDVLCAEGRTDPRRRRRSDQVVPTDEGTLFIKQRYLALGGKIVVIHKPGCDHHPHGLDNPQAIVDFVLEHAR